MDVKYSLLKKHAFHSLSYTQDEVFNLKPDGDVSLCEEEKKSVSILYPSALC